MHKQSTQRIQISTLQLMRNLAWLVHYVYSSIYGCDTYCELIFIGTFKWRVCRPCEVEPECNCKDAIHILQGIGSNDMVARTVEGPVHHWDCLHCKQEKISDCLKTATIVRRKSR